MERYKTAIKRVVISESELSEKVAQTGRYISGKYAGKPLLIVGVLKGCFMFMADLAKAVDIPCEIGFMAAESYSGTESVGEVRITLDLKQDISQYHVIIAEDIIDTGRTLSRLKKILLSRKPKSLELITLLDKPSRRVVDLTADVSLFTVPDIFVVGYGLDYNEKYRNLPYIAEINSIDN